MPWACSIGRSGAPLAAVAVGTASRVAIAASAAAVNTIGTSVVPSGTRIGVAVTPGGSGPKSSVTPSRRLMAVAWITVALRRPAGTLTPKSSERRPGTASCVRPGVAIAPTSSR